MKESRLYGLFEKRDGEWVRLFPGLAYRKSQAVKHFQSMLLGQAFGETANERKLAVVRDYGFCHD